MAESTGTWEEAEAAAKKALSLCGEDGIKHLQKVCENGGMCGRYFATCFYGTLARGDGYLDGVSLLAKEFEMVETYLRDKLGVVLPLNQMDPIESLVFPVCAGQTYRTNGILAHILMWCEEELGERARAENLPDMGIDLAIDEVAGKRPVMIH